MDIPRASAGLRLLALQCCMHSSAVTAKHQRAAASASLPPEQQALREAGPRIRFSSGGPAVRTKQILERRSATGLAKSHKPVAEVDKNLEFSGASGYVGTHHNLLSCFDSNAPKVDAIRRLLSSRTDLIAVSQQCYLGRLSRTSEALGPGVAGCYERPQRFKERVGR